MGQAVEECPHVGLDGLFPVPGQQLVDVFFRPGNAHVLPGDLGDGGQGFLLAAQLQQGPGMAFGESGLPQGSQNGVRVLQQAQLVGNGALAFSQQPCRLLLTHIPVLHKPGDAHGLLNIVQILPLEIFHHSRQAGFPVIHAHKDAGDVRDPGKLGGPEPPLSGNQLVGVSAPADGEGLQNTVLPDRLGQLVQGLRMEDFSGLGRIGSNGTGRQENHPSGFHVGFQLLTLHCPSSLFIGDLIVSRRDMGKPAKTAGPGREVCDKFFYGQRQRPGRGRIPRRKGRFTDTARREYGVGALLP